MAADEAKVAALETHMKDIDREIGEIKEDLKDLRGLTTAIERLAISVKTMSEKVDKIDTRLESVESEPGESFKHYKRVIIGCIITGVIGVIVGALLALIMR